MRQESVRSSWCRAVAQVLAVSLAAAAAVVALPDPVSAVRVWYVAPSGDDAAAGTVSAPLKTMGRAASRAMSGDTVQLAAGTYREQVQIFGKGIEVRGAGEGVTVFDGARRVDGWSPQDGLWWAAWDTNFARADEVDMRPDNLVAGNPEQFFVDGTPLREVDARSKVTATSFFNDKALNRVWIGLNPASRTVEGSFLNWALYFNQAHSSVLRDVTVQRYATQQVDLGAVRAYSDNLVVTDVTSKFNAFAGLMSIGHNNVFDNVTLSDNGHSAMGAWRNNNLTVKNSALVRNNTQGFNSSWSAGGIKITYSNGVTVTGNLVADNNGPGIWIDLDVFNTVISRNLVRDNARSGLMLEVSKDMVAVDNTITGNGQAGLYVLESQNVGLWHNSVFDNYWDLRILTGPRLDVSNVDVYNNTFGGSGPAGQALLHADDWTAKLSVARMNLEWDYNRTWWPTTSRARWFSRIANWPAGDITTTSIGEHRAATGGQAMNSEMSRAITNPYAPNVGSGDGRASAGSPLARALPVSIASAMGVPAGTRLPAGALSDLRPLLAGGATPPPDVPPQPPAPTPPLPAPGLRAGESVVALLAPTRLFDTRTPASRFQSGETRLLQISGRGGVPAGARAAALNSVAVNPSAPGFVTVWPCSSASSVRPTVSNLNFVGGSATATNSTVTLSPAGQVCVFSSAATDIVVDVTAAFVPEVSSATSELVAEPYRRVLDTRSGFGGSTRLAAGQTVRVAVTSTDAHGVVANVTAVGASESGFLTVWSCAGARPNTSALNYVAGSARANNTIVATTGGALCIYAHTAVDVVVDVAGALVASGSTTYSLVYLPTEPKRVNDSRDVNALVAGVPLRVDVADAPVGARLANVNVAGMAQRIPGWMVVLPCGTQPGATSTLNQQPGQAVSAAAVSEVSFLQSGVASLCVTADAAADVVVDHTGWWVEH